MPNWCTNTLTVTGPAEAVQRIVTELAQPGAWTAAATDAEAACSTTSDLHLCAMVDPRGIATEALMGKEPGWYEDHIAGWGTKWEVDAERNDVAADHVVYRFDSAWSPPIPAVTAYAARHPEATFCLEYDEPGNNFAGRYSVRGDDLIEDIEEESLSFWCDICDEGTLVELGEPRECGSDSDPLPQTLAGLIHAIARPDVTPTVVAELLNAVIENEPAARWMDTALLEAVENYGFMPTLDERIAVLTALTNEPDLPAWVAHLIFAGLPGSDVNAAMEHSDPLIAQTAHVGTVGYALSPGYGD